MTHDSEAARAMLGRYADATRVGPRAREALWERLQGSIADGADEALQARLEGGLDDVCGPSPWSRRTTVALVGTIAAAAVILFSLRWAVDQAYPLPGAGHDAAAFEAEPDAEAEPTQPRAKPAPMPAPTPAPAGALQPGDVETPTDDPPPAAPKAGRGQLRHRTPGQPPAPAASTGLSEELALMRTARAALDRDAPAEALAVLKEHARRFPSGQLTEDRQALRVVALCRAGRLEQGGQEAAAFGRAHPRSHHRAAIEGACE